MDTSMDGRDTSNGRGAPLTWKQVSVGTEGGGERDTGTATSTGGGTLPTRVLLSVGVECLRLLQWME